MTSKKAKKGPTQVNDPVFNPTNPPSTTPATPSTIRTMLGSSANDPAAIGTRILAILSDLTRGSRATRNNSSTAHTLSNENLRELTTLATHLGTIGKMASARLSEDVAAMRKQLENLAADFTLYTARIEILENGPTNPTATPGQPCPPTFATVAARGAASNDLGTATERAQEWKHARRQRRAKGADRLTLCQTKTREEAVFTSTPVPELTVLVNNALKESKVRNRQGVTIQAKSTARHPSKDILVIFHNDEDTRMAKENENWIAKLSSNLRLQSDNFVIVIQDLPVGKFDPENAQDISRLKRANPGLLDSATRYLWAAGKKVHKEGQAEKSTGSLIVHLSDGHQANSAITRGVALDGQDHTVYKSRRPIIQCHRCQHFGHTAARCAKNQACGRCASDDHSTRECNCKETTPCEDHKTCTHIQTKCILCNGEHRAGAEGCPVRQEAELALRIRNNQGGEFFILSDP